MPRHDEPVSRWSIARHLSRRSRFGVRRDRPTSGPRAAPYARIAVDLEAAARLSPIRQDYSAAREAAVQVQAAGARCVLGQDITCQHDAERLFSITADHLGMAPAS